MLKNIASKLILKFLEANFFKKKNPGVFSFLPDGSVLKYVDETHYKDLSKNTRVVFADDDDGHICNGCQKKQHKFIELVNFGNFKPDIILRLCFDCIIKIIV